MSAIMETIETNPSPVAIVANYHRLSLTLNFFRIFRIINEHIRTISRDHEEDNNLMCDFLNRFEDIETSLTEREEMMETYISFVTKNKNTICDKYNENMWNNIEIEENNKFHIAMRNLILLMNRHQKQIIDVLIIQFAVELGFFDKLPLPLSQP